MDPTKLTLELIDFEGKSPWRWRIRRFFIGYLLLTWYLYAIIFFYLLIGPEGAEFLGLEIGSGEYQLLITVTFGLLGSMYLVTRTFIRTVQKRDFPIVWYIARPIQGAIMALFVYYTFRAGQLAFFNGGETPVTEDQINIWMVSTLAILTGAFADEAFQKLYSIAQRMFSTSN